MSELNEVKNVENFEQLLNENGVKTLSNGDLVSGYVTAVTEQEVTLALDGTKYTGVLKVEDTSDPTSKLTEKYKVGDTIKASVYFVSEKDGIVNVNTKKIDLIDSINALVEARENKTILESKVDSVNKGGVVVTAFNQRVFIPSSQTDLAKDADLNTLLGQVVQFRITDVDERKRRVIGSIRSVAREARKQLVEAFWNEIEVGKHYNGVVKTILNYGVFVDLGGVDGMVHNSELSWTHISNPKKIVSIGQELDVFVKSFDKEKGRITLGYKTEETNPWNIFKSQYNVGDVIETKVVSIMNYGAFATIVPGVDGLIHISQISNKHIDDIAKELEKGQVVTAKIINVDDENKKVSLSMRALLKEEPVVEEQESGDVVSEETTATVNEEDVAESGENVETETTKNVETKTTENVESEISEDVVVEETPAAE